MFADDTTYVDENVLDVAALRNALSPLPETVAALLQAYEEADAAYEPAVATYNACCDTSHTAIVAWRGWAENSAAIWRAELALTIQEHVRHWHQVEIALKPGGKIAVSKKVRAAIKMQLARAQQPYPLEETD